MVMSMQRKYEATIYDPPLQKCSVCKEDMVLRPDENPTKLVVATSETLQLASAYRSVCNTPGCRTTHRGNFAYEDGVKVNALSFQQLHAFGVYMVTGSFGFSIKYLELSLLRFLRGNLAPGQEASVRLMHDPRNPDGITQKHFRQHLMHALEGYALAKRTPTEVVKFAVDNPTHIIPLDKDIFVFPTPTTVKVLSFDGHFGVHRRLHDDLEPPRTVGLKGRPKKKKYQKEQRTCTCANKDRRREAPQNRTGGWQFVLDPDSRRVLAAKEHLVNENLPDKVSVVKAAMGMAKVNPDALVHDDACHFEIHIKKYKALKTSFKNIKHFVVDEFHRCNHKCKKKTLTPAEKKRFKKVRTNMSEVFNSWIRRKNFILNGMNPFSHRFWVQESINFWNANLRDMPTVSFRRTNVTTRGIRKRPASK